LLGVNSAVDLAEEIGGMGVPKGVIRGRRIGVGVGASVGWGSNGEQLTEILLSP
jgi:hypothetical protein